MISTARPVFNTVVALFKIQLHKSINFEVSKDLTYCIHTRTVQRALEQNPELLQNRKPTLAYLHENTTHKAK